MDGPPLHSITEVSGSADEDTWTPLHWSAFDWRSSDRCGVAEAGSFSQRTLIQWKNTADARIVTRT